MASNKAQIAVLKKAIDDGAFTKESALVGIRNGMKDRIKVLTKEGKPINFQTLTEEIRADKPFLEQFERLEIFMKDFEDIAEKFAEPGMIEVVRSEMKTGRNDPCPCGSGKKYKKCCGR